jgi:hypothetical protein
LAFCRKENCRICPNFVLFSDSAGKPSFKGPQMKIKIEGDRIIKAVKKLDGIEMVLENAGDAKEALDLILRKGEFLKGSDSGVIRGLKVSSFQEYKTSAVDYKIVFLLEFVFEEGASVDIKVKIIKDLQEFFSRL